MLNAWFLSKFKLDREVNFAQERGNRSPLGFGNTMGQARPGSLSQWGFSGRQKTTRRDFYICVCVCVKYKQDKEGSRNRCVRASAMNSAGIARVWDAVDTFAVTEKSPLTCCLTHIITLSVLMCPTLLNEGCTQFCTPGDIWLGIKKTPMTVAFFDGQGLS